MPSFTSLNHQEMTQLFVQPKASGVRLFVVSFVLVCCLFSVCLSAASLALPEKWPRLSLNSTAWSVTSSPLICRMEPASEEEQLANGFQQEAGKGLEFYTPWSLFDSSNDPSQTYDIWALDPIWKNVKDARLLGQAQFQSASFAPPSALASPQLTQTMLSFLNDGQQLWIQPAVRKGASDPRGYLISNVGFRLAYRQFERCLSQLMPKNFQQLEKVALSYQGKNKLLSRHQQGRLSEISRYMKADPSVQGLYIDGHSNSKGLRGDNLKLSESRALNVADYLETQGVRRDQMVVRWHGERYPIASNRSEKGRQKNSRVTVRMSQLPMVYPKAKGIESPTIATAVEAKPTATEKTSPDDAQNTTKPSVTMGSSSSYSRLQSD